MSFIVSIDGNIGSGKTTVLQEIEKLGFPVFYEPFEANPYLPLYYQDPERYAFHVQIWFLTARRKQYNHAQITDSPIVFVERTVYSDKYIFAELLRRQGKLSPLDWIAYNYHFDTCKTHIPDFSLVLSVKPEECQKRIIERGREMEANIPLEYLQDLGEMYAENYDKLGILCAKNYYQFSPPEIALSIQGQVKSIIERRGGI